jgi:putative heme iron utilization protein
MSVIADCAPAMECETDSRIIPVAVQRDAVVGASRSMDETSETRRYLRHHYSGVLSTVSTKLGGYPFGSIVPFVLDADCHPVILVSALAEHTKNMAADPRVSLIVHDYAEDVQSGARLTLVGDALQIANASALQARYLRYFPSAQRLLALGDFAFWTIAPKHLLFIRGFGRIHWMDFGALILPSNRLPEAEEEILAHMNADHRDALVAYCRHVHGVSPNETAMVGIDCDGFDLRGDGKLLRFDFAEPATNAGKAREALVAMARAARGA